MSKGSDMVFCYFQGKGWFLCHFLQLLGHTIFTQLAILVRSANSKPELSQLLFISVRQRELVKSSCWIGLSTYTNTTWSVHYSPALPCDLVTCDRDRDVTWSRLVSHGATDFPML